MRVKQTDLNNKENFLAENYHFGSRYFKSIVLFKLLEKNVISAILLLLLMNGVKDPIVTEFVFAIKMYLPSDISEIFRIRGIVAKK